MALTEFQRRVCRVIAENRIASGESYVAGAAALNELIGAARISHDVDLFHDTAEALESSWDADRALLEQTGFRVSLVRERPFFVEAEIIGGGESVLLQWAQDSAFRFFPLVQHDELGLVLHPFDLATNKVLALVGRLEVRDWIDIIECDERVQPLGYLAWAACAKDPGFSPQAILEQAGRSAHYSAEEVSELTFEGMAPSASDLARRWHAALGEARQIVEALPSEHVGACVLTPEYDLFRGSSSALAEALSRDDLRFHAGSIRGALPHLKRMD